MAQNIKVFLSADSGALDSTEGKKGEMHPHTHLGYNMYANEHTDTKQDYVKTSRRRFDLKKTISRENSNINYFPVFHFIERFYDLTIVQLAKLVHLRLNNTFKNLATATNRESWGLLLQKNDSHGLKNNTKRC